MPLLTKADLPHVPFADTILKLFSVDKVNRLYDSAADKKGADFAQKFLKNAGINYTIENEEILDRLPDGPFVTVSNHPFGSVDGLMLLDIFGHRYPGFKIMVNRFLMRISAAEDSFIPVTPEGRDHPDPKENIPGIKEVIRNIREGNPVGFFPSGAVSDSKGIGRHTVIQDRPWQESVIKLIKKLDVPVVPVQFLDHNSRWFYFLGHIGWGLRITRLPYEIINKRGKTLRVRLWEPTGADQLGEIEKSFASRL